MAAVQNFLQLHNNEKVTHCCISIPTLNSFILLTAICSLTIQCISIVTQYFLLLTWTYIVPQDKRSTMLYFHGNIFSSCILLIMHVTITKKKALLFPWLQWLCKHYIICMFSLIFQVYILSDTLLQKFCMLSMPWPSHSHAASIAASLSILFNNIGKLHLEIFVQHYTSC